MLDYSGTGTGTTVTTDSSPLKSAGLVVNRGSLFAAAMLANEDAGIRSALDAFRQAQTAAVIAKPDPRRS